MFNILRIWHRTFSDTVSTSANVSYRERTRTLLIPIGLSCSDDDIERLRSYKICVIRNRTSRVLQKWSRILGRLTIGSQLIGWYTVHGIWCRSYRRYDLSKGPCCVLRKSVGERSGWVSLAHIVIAAEDLRGKRSRIMSWWTRVRI